MKDTSEEGFTLVEALVAFAILAAALIYSGRIFSENLQRLQRGKEAMLELTIAKKLLQEVMTGKPLSPRQLDRELDGHSYNVEIVPSNVPNMPPPSSQQERSVLLIRIYAKHGTKTDRTEPLLEAFAMGQAEPQ